MLWSPFPIAANASDHADPLEVPTPFTLPLKLLDANKPSKKDLEGLSGGITDLFIFPIKEDGQPAFFPPADEYELPNDAERAELDKLWPEERAVRLQMNAEERTAYAQLNPGDAAAKAALLLKVRARRFKLQELDPEQFAQIKGLAVILCVRRDVITPPPYALEPYTYSIHMDQHTTISYDRPEDQSTRARYGGAIPDSTTISPDVTITVRLNNDGTRKSYSITGLDNQTGIKMFPDEMTTAVREDPFVFPRFFKKNTIAMVFTIPLTCFSKTKTSHQWIAWATTMRDGKQIDHVGRSLRTQQPRFNFLNGLEPRKHVAAIDRRMHNPTLLEDALLRLGFDSLYEYRPWDLAPDVMIYNAQYRARFPNGRMLTDDVASLLSRHGDALLLELSYKNATWPRATANDKPFQAGFPFLADPWGPNDVTPPPMRPVVSKKHKMMIVIAGLAVVVILFGLGWISARWFGRRRETYL